jgi:hypothetical protein
LLDEYAAAEGKEQVDQVLAKIKAIRRNSRRMFFLESMEPVYKENIYEDTGASSVAGGTGQQTAARGFEITITGRTPLSEIEANRFLAAILRSWDQQAQRFPMITVVDSSQQLIRGSAGRGRKMPIMMKSEYGPMADLGPRTSARDSDEEGLQAEQPDPMFPDDPLEDMAKDTRFEITLTVSIEEPEQESGSSSG